MVFLRDSTDSQWSLVFASSSCFWYGQFITKDMAVRSKLVAWTWVSQERYDDTYILSRAPVSLPSATFASCTVDSRYQKFDYRRILEQSSVRWVFSGLEGIRVDLMDSIDFSRGGDMEFLRGSIVSYPVICTPSHSFVCFCLSHRQHINLALTYLLLVRLVDPRFITYHTR